MTDAELAIARTRRDLTLATVLKVAILAGMVLALPLGPALKINGAWILIALLGLWMVLNYRSLKDSRMAALLPSLIAAGRHDEAEERIRESLQQFSLSRAAKLLSLHNLAFLRHEQRRWRESALLCHALLRERLGQLGNLGRATRLILADALLEMNNLPGAHQALASLYRERLTLPEAMNLLAAQLDYESRIGAWESMMHNVMHKVQMAELMPRRLCARTQAMLALAAQRIGRADWSDWLRRRVELLADPGELTRGRPVLLELWP